MSMNLIAILISLAVMLTGAGADGQPAEAARTLILRDLSFSVNGEQVDLAPSLRLGASTDGQTALFDFGIEAGGETLLPMQVKVDENAVTALFDKSDVAVSVTAQAFEALTEGMTDMVQSDDSSSELFTFLTEEFMPAYMGMIEATQDESFREEVNAAAQPIYDRIVDRGEGTPVTEEIDGESYELTEYVYTIETEQLSRLCDEVLQSNDTFRAYYDAMFKMYSMMPEESGMSGITSYADMFEKTGIQVTMNMTERTDESGDINVTDAVVTMDLSGMVARMATEEEAQEVAMEPMVMNIHSTKAGNNQVATADMEFEMTEGDEKVAMDMTMRATQAESAMTMDMEMNMNLNDASRVYTRLNLGIGELDAQTTSKHAEFELDMGDEGSCLFTFEGTKAADGSSVGQFWVNAAMNGNTFDLGFVAELANGAIEDRVSGREADVVIEDLSAVGEDEAVSQAVAKISGSMLGDAQKLMADESVQAMISKLSAMPESMEESVEVEAVPEDVTADSEEEVEIDLSELEALDGGDFDIEIEGLDDFEEIEDDGVLGFNVPELTWLPDGWSVNSRNEDTAYDWADITVKDENGNDVLYAVFFSDEEEGQTSYIIDDRGGVSPVEGREISVVDFGENGLSVTLRESGLYTNLLFYSNTTDIETVGKVIAGMQF